MADAFESPLLLRVHTEFTAIDLGRVQAAPGVQSLRGALDDALDGVVAALPAPLDAEARALLAGYAGGGSFFGLFYVPVWSFLHWAPAAAPLPPPAQVLGTARTAHALALFLHLWDDHLSDGQLAPDLLRLQLRTLAWARFTAQARTLAAAAGARAGVVDAHARDYLVALHRPEPVSNLDGYLARFGRQVAVWTLVPRLLGRALAGPAAGKALAGAVEHFAAAWRLVDDLQDVHLDARAGAQTAVWLALDEEGRRRWEAFRDAGRAGKEPDPGTWEALAQAVRAPACRGRLLARARAELAAAAKTARAHGWAGWADEVESCARGLPHPPG
ncbi:MAG TPA: hypothetical protein VLK84_21915 [Longimicrobium sp.]|nr:hypothetical protein [Longimicrobium sp.]